MCCRFYVEVEFYAPIPSGNWAHEFGKLRNISPFRCPNVAFALRIVCIPTKCNLPDSAEESNGFLRLLGTFDRASRAPPEP